MFIPQLAFGALMDASRNDFSSIGNFILASLVMAFPGAVLTALWWIGFRLTRKARPPENISH
jgi:hypothetical protein